MFPLIPDASISGAVLDEENEAVRSGDVMLFARDAATGRMESRAHANVEDQGRYHFGHLPPGNISSPFPPSPGTQPTRTIFRMPYSSRPKRSSPYKDATPAAGGDAALDVTYRITFYADAVDGESATPIQLHPGERANADITLRAVPAAHLIVRHANRDPNQPGSQKSSKGFSIAPSCRFLPAPSLARRALLPSAAFHRSRGRESPRFCGQGMDGSGA